MIRRRLRRCLQFSLGTLLLLVTICGIWLGIYADRAHKQKAATEAIIRLGGYVSVAPYGPQCLRGLLDDSFTTTITEVTMRGALDSERSWSAPVRKPGDWCNLTDEDLQIFENLPELRQLDLSYTILCPGSLRHLATLKELESLRLPLTRITDDDLGHLARLTNLGHLQISFNSITSDGLRHLRGLRRLKWLDLSGTKVDDKGMKYLEGLPALRTVCLYGTEITAHAIEGLSHMASLREIDVSYFREMTHSYSGPVSQFPKIVPIIVNHTTVMPKKVLLMNDASGRICGDLNNAGLIDLRIE